VIATPRRPISLVEHESILLAQDEMTREEGEGLWRRYRDHVEVDFPSPVTSGNWRLSAEGWVGHLPVSEEFAVEIKPKVGVHNLFRMLE